MARARHEELVLAHCRCPPRTRGELEVTSTGAAAVSAGLLAPHSAPHQASNSCAAALVPVGGDDRPKRSRRCDASGGVGGCKASASATYTQPTGGVSLSRGDLLLFQPS